MTPNLLGVEGLKLRSGSRYALNNNKFVIAQNNRSISLKTVLGKLRKSELLGRRQSGAELDLDPDTHKNWKNLHLLKQPLKC